MVDAPLHHGVAVVDKPAGITSHDVVAEIRRRAHQRRVGHGGTLDPMATGVLVVALGSATRLLTWLAAGDKQYDATIRLGQSTNTDDATGEVIAAHDVSQVSDDDLAREVRALTGAIEQVPSTVSAVKTEGERSYRRARRGEQVTLPARPVVVSSFTVLDVQRSPTAIDVDVTVTVSGGTYVRALARDLGVALGVGGHLTQLRRTRVGAFDITAATPLSDVDISADLLPLDTVVPTVLPTRVVTDEEARAVRHGSAISRLAESSAVAAFDAEGHVLAVMSPSTRADEEHLLRVQVGLSEPPARLAQ